MTMLLTRADSAPGSSHTVSAINHPAKIARTSTIPNVLPMPTASNTWRNSSLNSATFERLLREQRKNHGQRRLGEPLLAP